MSRYDRPPISSNPIDNRRNFLKCIDSNQRLVVDGVGDQSFAKNSHGWIMNDLSLLVNANTKQDIDFAMSRLREIGLPGTNNEGKTVREVLDNIIPRYVQTPSELSRYAEFYSSFGDNSRFDNKDQSVKQQSDDLDKQESVDS